MNKPKSYMPRKPSKTFSRVFLENTFDDGLRPKNHPNKGRTEDHGTP